MKTQYVCEYCGRPHSTAAAALACEGKHKPKTPTRIFCWSKLIHEAGLPDTVTIEFDSGTHATYHLHGAKRK